jgi:Major Facilitator Superfamily
MIPSRWAAALVFAMHGIVAGTLAARMPWIAQHVGVGNGVGRLGYALVMPAVGGLLTMPFAGRIVHRFGNRRSIQVLMSCWGLSLILISWAPNLPALAAAMFLGGAFAGTADMAMNSEAIAVERELGRSIMSGLHGMWSIGGFAAGGIGWAMAHLGIDGRPHFAGIAVLVTAISILTYSVLTRPETASSAAPAGAAEEEGGPKFAFPRGIVLVIGLVGFASVFAEASGADWSAVFLVNELGGAQATGAVAYACFAGAMTIGRLTGDAVVGRFGPIRTVRVAGSLGVLGGVLICVAGLSGQEIGRIVAIGGFTLVGFGIAVVVPLAFSAAGHTAKTPAARAHAIAGVATVAYGAGLAAPGIIGGIAGVTSLTASFAVVTALIVVMTLAAPALRGAGHSIDDEVTADAVAAGRTPARA